MKAADGYILFKEWLPDLPDLDNPGLTEAKNVLPVDGTYKTFYDLNASGTANISAPRGAYRAYSTAGAELIVGFAGSIQKEVGLSWTVLSASVGVASYWRFAQYDDLVIAASDATVPLTKTVGGASSFANLATAGSAPVAQQVARIGQFVVLGDRNNAEPHSVQWSAINDPRNWPTPGSSTAIAAQSGEQLLNATFGTVNALFGGDQHGVILQSAGITRMTYVGGSTVFQFDEISNGIGCHFPNSAIQVGGLIYFATDDGFFRCNGVGVDPIGLGKVNKYFTSRVDFLYPERVWAGVDWLNNCIYWSYPVSGDAGAASKLLIFNYAENRWARAETPANSLVYGNATNSYGFGLEGFNASNAKGTFPTAYAQPGGPSGLLTAVLTTGETEISKGSYTRVQGVKGIVSGASGFTVAVGTRNDQLSSVSYTSETAPTSRTGFSDFRSEARYHRARLTITTTFNSAQGIEYQFAPSGPL